MTKNWLAMHLRMPAAAVSAALLLVLTASAQVGLDVAQLHHMNAGMGWVWDDTNQKVIGWWTILGVGNILLALGSLLGWRPGFVLTAVWGGLFALLWLAWSVTFVVKTGRLENPELYLYVVPPAFFAAYAAVAFCAVRLIASRNGLAAAERSGSN